MPFLRFEAPSRVKTPIFSSGVVLMSLMMRASTLRVSSSLGFAGSAMS